MAAAALASSGTTTPLARCNSNSKCNREAMALAASSLRLSSKSKSAQSLLLLLSRTSSSSSTTSRTRRRRRTTTFTLSPVMEWQDCSSVIEVDVPCSVAYECYSDRESIPQWMPFISSVKVLKDKPDLSRWTLKYEIFGRDVEFSWLARNMQPIRNQKIHWRSLEGLPNRGAVRFFPRGSSSCRIELTVSYELPQILIPVASAVKPFLEGLLSRGLEQFATFARDYHRKASQL